MRSLGETLRQARLDRGATLGDAEQETRIRRKYLEALESEDYAALPAQVYTRGFIRTYARYLGLDPEAVLDLYTPARTREERPPLRAATAQVSSGRPAPTRVFTLIAGLVLVGLLLAYLWTQYTSFVESLNPGEAGGARSVQATPIRGPTQGVTPPTAAAGGGQTVTPTAAGAAASPTPERGLVLEARVTDRTWMEVWVDGASQVQTTLQAGASRSFTANQSIRMRVGNAGGVQVTVNGEPQGALGDKNQVKEFVWER